MPGKIIKLNGIYKALENLTGVNFKFLPAHKEISPPLCNKKQICKANNFKKQRIDCQGIEVSRIRKCRNPDLKICKFICGSSELILPVFNKRNLIGVVLSDKINKKTNRLNSGQIASLASILDYCRCRLVENAAFCRDSVPNTKDKVIIQRAKNFIEKNYHNAKIPLRDLAREVNTSYFYLCRLFKRELNLTFVRYLTLLRLRAALKLLENLNLTVAQVAYAVGFSDAQYFDRVFKKILNCRPIEYRLSPALKKEKIRQKVLSPC